MSDPEAKFIEYHPDENSEDPRYVKGNIDGFKEAMREKDTDKK